MDENPLLVATSNDLCSLYCVQNADSSSSYSILMTYWRGGEVISTSYSLWSGDVSSQDFMLTVNADGTLQKLKED